MHISYLICVITCRLFFRLMNTTMKRKCQLQKFSQRYANTWHPSIAILISLMIRVYIYLFDYIHENIVHVFAEVWALISFSEFLPFWGDGYFIIC